ncbi:3,4-dihydroxy-2-butanone-4-phosphate synthase [cf. Phormidesmis sp. LEGE 11477]|uniref:3,4-dihydroxy-2-butanone-4-phosphate synthase n=1 Tax=cf. Phormidesmis sp. LEGE 11477 TaxID=1828680 RepID=UPI00188011BF|nr:3,4-dihydroxy-2-butanone-4-phosphate synthase [cf. Phormidesmis sp. LEGE 11477]MBE9061396.1 3,4-dihydroxy-2-butanone-4-phosphate synthase [cf. Phormidesmis sp. LEGE 11477]
MFSTVEEALAEMKVGRSVIVFDDKSWRQSVYLMCAAQFVTPERVEFMTTQARGSLSVAPLLLAMEQARLQALALPSKPLNGIPSGCNENKVRELSAGIRLSLSVSGASAKTAAEGQARTVQACLNPQTKPEDLQQSGNIFPVGAQTGGVLARARYSEAAVDLARLAGLYPAGLVCGVKSSGHARSDASGKQRDVALAYAKRHHLKVIRMTDLIAYRLSCETLVACEAVTQLPTEFGAFKVQAYRSLGDRSEHLAIIKGNPMSAGPVRVYLHTECLIGDAFSSLRCSCRNQLSAAMGMIAAAGQGVIVYLRPADHGRGLVDQLKRYASKDTGTDTVKVHDGQSIQLAPQTVSLAAQILEDIGIHDLLLITRHAYEEGTYEDDAYKNSAYKNDFNLANFGINVVNYIPLVPDINANSSHLFPSLVRQLSE